MRGVRQACGGVHHTNKLWFNQLSLIFKACISITTVYL